MERVTFKNSRGQTLVGNMYSSDSNSVVIMSHGFTGDKSELGLFDIIAKAMADTGLGVLAFDFSGCGESDDDTLTLDKQVNDLNSAIDYVHSAGFESLGLLGYSLGALISLKAYHQHPSEISTMMLIAPVTDRVHYEWKDRYAQEQMAELKRTGMITKTREEGVRHRIMIDGQMLKDRESVDQQSLLSGIECPVFMIHGDKDERVPYHDTVAASKYLMPVGSRADLVHGTGHKFEGKQDYLARQAAEWFSGRLKAA